MIKIFIRIFAALAALGLIYIFVTDPTMLDPVHIFGIGSMLLMFIIYAIFGSTLNNEKDKAVEFIVGTIVIVAILAVAIYTFIYVKTIILNK